MAAPTLKINNAAIGAIAKGAAAQQVVTAAAQKIAAEADSIMAADGNGDVEANVTEYRTDRAVASVGVPGHLQARDGVLSRAAAQAGIPIAGQ